MSLQTWCKTSKFELLVHRVLKACSLTSVKDYADLWVVGSIPVWGTSSYIHFIAHTLLGSV